MARYNTNMKLHNNLIDSSRVIINTIRSNVIISEETVTVFDMCYRIKCDDTIPVLSLPSLAISHLQTMLRRQLLPIQAT